MKAANALGAKTARACDSCLRRRARLFCAADDAFLCHGCDNLVHSANQLARRHERVRLQTSSSTSATTPQQQAWHSGFTRKARTPRRGNKHLLSQQQQRQSKHEQEEEEEALFVNSTLPVVPELGSEEPVMEESEEQLLCRVPEFDPFEAEHWDIQGEIGDERLDSSRVAKKDDEETCGDDLDNFPEFLGSDMDLAELAADVESLLERGLVDEESGAQVFDCNQEDGEMEAPADVGVGGQTSAIKIKDEQEVVEAHNNNNNTGVHLEALNWNTESETCHDQSSPKGKLFLRLNYKDVISAWASQGCPWTTGNPPQLNSDDCLGRSEGDVDQWCYGIVGRLMGQVGSGDGGREARVTRYREKRRTRLFAKKIRYEVRKLNAEKRPRMKGRFVKRASFLGTTTALPPPASR